MRDKKLTKWGKSWKSLKKPWGLRLEWDESVWERKWESYRERDRRKWAVDRTRRLYRPSVNLDRCKCWEVSRQLSRKVSRKRSSIDTGIKEVSKNNPSNARTEARSIHQLSRSYQGGRSLVDLSTRYREAVEIAIWKSFKELDRQQGIEEVSSPNVKAIFREEKNTDMNAIKYATQPMIQITY